MQYDVTKLIDLLEDDPKILSYKIRGQSLWMISRQLLVRRVITHFFTTHHKPVKSLPNIFTKFRDELIFTPISLFISPSIPSLKPPPNRNAFGFNCLSNKIVLFLSKTF